MKTPIERIAEAASEKLFSSVQANGPTRLESVNLVRAMLAVTPAQARAVAAEVLRDIMPILDDHIDRDEHGKIAKDDIWSIAAYNIKQAIVDFAASLGVELSEKEESK